MIKENQKLFNRLNVITDAAAAFIAITAAYLLVFHLLDFDRNYPLVDYIKLLLIFVPVQLMTYGCMGLYGSFRRKRFATELGRLFTALLLDGLALIALLYVVQIINFSRWALAIFLALDFLLVTLKRFILRKTLRHFREGGYNLKHVLIVGSGAAAQDFLGTVREDRSLGLSCDGYVSDGDIGELTGLKKLGTLDKLLGVLEERSYDEVVCALDAEDSNKLSGVVEACELTGTKISVIPTIYRYMSSTPEIDMVGNIPLMNIRRIPLDNIGNAALKRTVDIVGSLVLLVLTSPVVLVSMLVIKCTMGGDVIFRQKRVGLNKKVFTMYKLKSMRDSAESDTAWSKDVDPRRTRFGSFIRKFSIDELPQLVNVLKGDMSLVGPRPEIPFYVNDFKDKIPMYMIKHQVKPGITGLAQVNGYRGDTSIQKRIEFDIQYIENWSFFLDISILLKTALSGFMNSEKLAGSSKSPETQKKKNKPYKAEKLPMNKNAKIDLMALVMFLPSVIALALVPVIMHITKVTTSLVQTYMYHGGTPLTDDSGTTYALYDIYSQGKAVAVIVLALIMIGMALVCCLSLFRRIEKRSLVYVGCSVVYVIMALASALLSEYSSVAFSGEYDRAEGFWVTACYFVLFLFTMYAFRTSGNFRFVAIALFVCVGVNALIGVFQITGANLLNQEWFRNLITDGNARNDNVQISISSTLVYGALYNGNYVGSFGGLVIPLFTVMAVYSEKALWRVLYILFDALAVFLLVGSTARSGIVALAAALVVGIVVFARQIGKHWKRCVVIVAAAAVMIVGANFALGNRLFIRIPSLVSDAIGLFVPSGDDSGDLYSKIPLRNIETPSDGTLRLTGQGDTMTIAYSKDTGSYTFTDSSGNEVPRSSHINVAFDDVNTLSATIDYGAGTMDFTISGAYGRVLFDQSGSLVLDEGSPNDLSPQDGSAVVEIDQLGTITVSSGESSLVGEYSPEYGRMLFTSSDDTELFYNDQVSFTDDSFSGVHLILMASEKESGIYDVIALSFNDDTTNSLFFSLFNEKRIAMIHYRTASEFVPVNADHIGFDGKERLGSSRGYIWSRTFPLLSKCLVTGYGADTFTYEFPQNDVLAKYYSYEPFNEGFYVTVDKPHNLYIQMFFSNGLIALIAFLGICVFYLVDCFRLYALRREYRAEQIMGAAVMLGIVGYLAAGMFNDSTVHVAPVFWILLGTGAALNTINRRADRNIAVDEDYVPVESGEPVITPEQAEKDRTASAAGEILASLIRSENERQRAEAEKQRKLQQARKITREDVSSLLESVRAIKTVEDKAREAAAQAEKEKDGGDDNG